VNQKEKHLGDLVTDGRTRHYGVTICNGLIWLKTGPTELGHDPSGSVDERVDIFMS
jgi:hypothetical protein